MTTAALFFLVHGDEPTTVTASVPIRVTVPKNMVLAEPIPDRTQINITGPRNTLKNFDTTRIEPMVLNIDNAKNNTMVPIPINQIDLPSGLRITNTQPDYVYVRLEDRVTKEVPVQARLLGTPSVEYTIKDVIEEPATVKVSGPKHSLAELNQLFTEPIPLNDIQNSVTKDVHIRLDDPLITFEGKPIISVKIETAATRTRANFTDLPVIITNFSRKTQITPKFVAIEVSGPTGVLESIHARDLKAVIDLSELENQPPQTVTRKPTILNLPKLVDIESITPNTIIIETYNEPSNANSPTPNDTNAPNTDFPDTNPHKTTIIDSPSTPPTTQTDTHP